MQIYHDKDADLGLLVGKKVAVLGYGNQGRSQALNLRDSGLDVIVGNRDDEYAEAARQDAFEVFSLAEAAGKADIILLLLPDEIMPELFDEMLCPQLEAGNVVVFASGFTISFELVKPPDYIDIVLVAPRMIGAGVRDLYTSGGGFPAFIGVEQDYSGNAHSIALAVAKGIGATRMGVVEVTFSQEAELDLFTEQCFGPAFGQVLVSAVDLLIEQGYPPEAVLLELYMSGEFSFTLAKIAEMGMIEQSSLHSLTSQYGSISRGMRFMLPEIRTKMEQGLDEIRSGAFAEEWAGERDAGYPTLEALRETARSLPLYKMEKELRQALGQAPALKPTQAWRAVRAKTPAEAPEAETMLFEGRQGWIATLIRRLRERSQNQIVPEQPLAPLKQDQAERVLTQFLQSCTQDAGLQTFAESRKLTVQYSLSDIGKQFYMCFEDGKVSADFGEPAKIAQVQLKTDLNTLDGMFSGRVDAMRATFSGKLKFDGDTKLAISIQQIQDDLRRLYRLARQTKPEDM